MPEKHESERGNVDATQGSIDKTVPAPRVSVVIPTYKRPELVRRAVLSLFAQDLEKDQYEIIVVDSSPDQQTVEVIEALESTAPCTLRLLVKEPEGPGPSRSLGVKHACGEYIAFMDSDCQASPGWLREGLKGFAEGVGIVQGRTEPDPEGVRGVFTWYVQVDHENFVYECCNIFYRRRALEEAGEFRPSISPGREHFLVCGEDVEMAWKVKRKGWKSCYAHQALVYHEIVPISRHRWIINERMVLYPELARTVPELRRTLFHGYFYDRAQQYLVLALVGLGLSWITPLAAVCWIPYIAFRMFEHSGTLKGPKRIMRPAAYLLKDLASFVLLVRGSFRYGSVLL